jgi:tripartite motif-containing protein 37
LESVGDVKFIAQVNGILMNELGNEFGHDQYISVFLEQLKGLKEPTTFSYRIQLINRERGSAYDLNREYTCTFEAGECWGYNRFCKIETVLKNGFWDESSDTLLFKFGLRNAKGWAGHCQDVLRYF